MHKFYFMKKLLPITAALILTIGQDIQAQTLPSAKVQQFKNDLLSTAPANTRGTNKTTATYWRVVATGNHAFDGSSLTPSDSTKYKYSNGRGSSFSISGDLEMDDYGLEASIMYDSAIKFQNSGSGLEFASLYEGGFNSKNERTRFTTKTPASGGGVANSSEHRADIDANGNITKVTYYTWNNGSSQWVANRATERMYDGQGNRVKDSSYNISTTGNTPTNMYIYTYDSNGDQVRMLEITWNGTDYDSSFQSFSTYANNKVVTVTDQYYDNNQWINDYFDSSGYNGSGIYNYSEYREWDTSAKEWINVEREIRTIGSNGLPATASISEWDTSAKKWEPLADADLVYDSNDNPTKLSVYVYLGGIKLPTPYYVSNLYYEHYFNVGVEGLAKTNTVNVYPNPATSNINIVSDKLNNATVTLTNMTGQVARTVQVAGSSTKASMNVSGLPAGNYILSITNNGISTARQMVTIQ